MVTRLSLVLLALLGTSCADDATTLVQYEDERALEKVNCAGGAKCAECCNNEVCAVGQECNAGASTENRVILFCDGPEDCAAPKVCCVKGSPGGALVGSCASTCNEGAKACHVPANCDGEPCEGFEPAPYIGVCGSSAE